MLPFVHGPPIHKRKHMKRKNEEKRTGALRTHFSKGSELKRSRSSGVCDTMAASTRAQVISLYRTMMRESSKFPSYNYRTYALRRVRDAFRANQRVEDPKTVARLMEEGQQAVALIQRQVTHTLTHT
ncbi:hypothetical protein INR49_029183, partial [Caranx melampygus]